MPNEPTADEISISEVLEKFDQDFELFSKAVENGEFSFWIGSGISRNAPDLGKLLMRALEFIREQAAIEGGHGKFSNAMIEILEIAGFRPETLELHIQEEFFQWPDQKAIIEELWNKYSEVLDVRVSDEPNDYVLWNAIGIREAFENPPAPAIEHICIAALILEGTVRDIASANWDTFIEQAVDQLSCGAPNILQVVVDPDHLRTPPGRARLLKFHGCIRHATDAPETFRKYLTGSTTQITDWPETQLFAAVRNEIVGIATNQKALIMGLSIQDQNLHQTFSRAKEANPWPWPCVPNAPGYVFCEDRLTAGQRSILKLVYGDRYGENAVDINAAAHLRAWPEQVLLALLLRVIFDKLDQMMIIWIDGLGKAGISAGLGGSLKECRDFVAGLATVDRQKFVEMALFAWPRLLSLYRRGALPTIAGGYEAVSATPLSQLAGDELAHESQFGKLALGLCLLNHGQETGLWKILPPQSEEVENGSFVVHAAWEGAQSRPIFIVKSVTEAILLENNGAFDKQGVIVIHGDDLWPQLRPHGGSARSPRSFPGRSGSARNVHLSLETLLEGCDDLGLLKTKFVTEAAI